MANSDIDKQKEFLRRIKEWKAKVAMLLEDHRTGKTFELISSLLKETLEFKYTVREVEDLKILSAAYKWNDNANAVIHKRSIITVEDLQELIREGKGNYYDYERVKELEVLASEVTKLKNVVQGVLKNHKVNTADALEELNKRVEMMGVDLKERGALSKQLKEVRQWRDSCGDFLKGECTVEQFEVLKRTAEELNVTCKEYERVCHVMEPAIQWFALTAKFLGKFAAPKNAMGVEHVAAELKKRGSSVKTLQSLIETATEISKTSDDYKSLVAMSQQLRQWENTADAAVATYIAENALNEEAIRSLLLVAARHPIDKARGLKLVDILSHEGWLKRAAEVLGSKVPLHVLEGVFREGNAFGVKVAAVEECLGKLEKKIAAAKMWMAKYKHIKVDIERGVEKVLMRELEAALSEAETLNVRIREIEILSTVFAEAKQLREDVKQMLGQKAALADLELLLRKVQEQNIHLEELEVLQALHQLAASWQKIASQVIGSRPVYCKSLVPASKEASKEISIILNMCEDGGYTIGDINIGREAEGDEGAEAVYCVCRANGEEKMVACDTCNEWFHLECIGLSEKLANQIPQFVCSACMKRKRVQVPYTLSLDSVERVGESDFAALLKQGNELPINFIELPLLEEIERRVEGWKERARRALKDEKCKFYMELLRLKADWERHFKKATENEEVLMKLYLESENFPVDTELANKIMCILMIKDWVHEILRHRSQGNSLKRRCKNVLEQVQRLNISRVVPEFSPLWECISALYNPATHSLVTEQGEYNKEETKEDVRHSVEYKIRLALETKRTREKDLRDIHLKLLQTRNPDHSLLDQIKMVLDNAEVFRAEAKKMYLQNLDDPRVLETICRQSLKVGCIPENVISAQA